jgi:GNAT superfamily N-acetyltransferase
MSILHVESAAVARTFRIIEADLADPQHQREIVRLIDHYARDLMGGGRALPDDVRERMMEGLRVHPTSMVLLAVEGAQAIGVAVCFKGYSTFAARPLINIHDLAVEEGHRGRGVGRRLLEAVEARARSMGCCKITLEVLGVNDRARKLYESFGFAGADHAVANGATLFCTKPL